MDQRPWAGSTRTGEDRWSLVKHIAFLKPVILVSLSINIYSQVAQMPSGQVVRAGNPPVYQKRRLHSLTLAIADNVRSAR